MSNQIKIKFPRVFEVVSMEQAIEAIKSDKYLAILIPIDDIL